MGQYMSTEEAVKQTSMFHQIRCTKSLEAANAWEREQNRLRDAKKSAEADGFKKSA